YETGDEESARAVDVREREQELRPRRMREGRPLVAEWHDGEAARVHDRLALVGVQRADGVEDRAAGANPLGGGAKQRELKVGQRGRAPAEIGALREDAETRAWRVDERPVEAAELLRQRGPVRLDDRDVGATHLREIVPQLARAGRVDLDRCHL